MTLEQFAKIRTFELLDKDDSNAFYNLLAKIKDKDLCFDMEEAVNNRVQALAMATYAQGFIDAINPCKEAIRI